MGNDIGEMSKQPDQEACCRYCRVTGRATVWTFSTGADYPQGCWCKTKQSINPNCNGPSCARVSGHFAPPCVPWGWIFTIMLLVGSILYGFVGMFINQRQGLDEMPNAAFWRETAALVRDGFAFATASAGGGVSSAMSRSRSSYTPVEGQGGAAAADQQEESPEAEEARKLRRKLEKKLKPSTPGPRTRLIEASIIGRRRTVKELLGDRDRAELDCGDQRGSTAFHHACAGGHVETLELLLAAGCKTTLTDDRGKTGWALARAAGPSRQAVTDLLTAQAQGGHKHLRLELEAVASEAGPTAQLDVPTMR